MPASREVQQVLWPAVLLGQVADTLERGTACQRERADRDDGRAHGRGCGRPYSGTGSPDDSDGACSR